MYTSNIYHKYSSSARTLETNRF